MILFQSHAIRLNYAPSTDILTADLSVEHEFYLLEIREVLRTISDAVRHYDVKRLLMDSRKRMLQIDKESYAQLMIEFASELNGTRLQKFGRLRSGVASREDLALYIQEQVAHNFTLRSFTDKDKAYEWLLQP
ncbi:hypothetical protein FVR03_17105 [Pontibacter qinzhouensis]|uniref:STAS/SEC14 domain-containing protein n=1 Tax=Pontibacter qinzhouensis TaxID=2603253 RepID=A0A5C8JJD4_9BACT|nr:hypothetical protein [Pontibacter qinzhouensis]TXK36697.1 hypothetical protein FVR03_17105 [Pontibacter qinzhouensis]